MEEMPVNLDDGELWLPSDIFPPEDNGHLHHNNNRPFAHGGASLEDLSRQFANLDFIDHHRIMPPKAPHVSERLGMFGPMAQYTLTTAPPNGSYGLTVGPMVDHSLYNYTSGPSLRYHMHKPVPPQQHPYTSPAEHMMETRIASNSRPVHGLQNRDMNRLLPFQANGFRLGSSIKDCRGPTSGTGVFIPRAATYAHKNATYDGGRRKSSGVAPHRGPVKVLGMGRAEGYYCHHRVPSSEVGLPKDWTY